MPDKEFIDRYVVVRAGVLINALSDELILFCLGIMFFVYLAPRVILLQPTVKQLKVSNHSSDERNTHKSKTSCVDVVHFCVLAFCSNLVALC